MVNRQGSQTRRVVAGIALAALACAVLSGCVSQGEFKAQQEAHNRLQADFDKLVAETVAHRSRTEEIAGQVAKLQGDLGSMKTQLEALGKALDKESEHVKNLRIDVDAYKAKVSQVENDMVSLERRLTDALDQHNRRLHMISDAFMKLMLGEADRLRSRLEELDDAVKTLKELGAPEKPAPKPEKAPEE